jgi:hypothetical protein
MEAKNHAEVRRFGLTTKAKEHKVGGFIIVFLFVIPAQAGILMPLG